MELVYGKERTLFVIAALVSGLFWLVLVGVTFGLALLWLAALFLFYLFAQAAFITYIRGNGVKISAEQFPDLHERLQRCARTVGLADLPDAYILRTDFFNALATRFLGRNYVVLFTDVLDALEDRPGAVDFYIGHELGHIHRRHLVWNAFLLPALVLPLLGSAYRRAEEYTCDRYGAACCETAEDVRAAIAAIAAGNTRWKSINVEAYMAQAAATNGFWMSFNELTNDYPWLTKRMASALAAKSGAHVDHPRRHLGAWILALFVPRFGVGGGASVLVTVAMIGVLAAIAIPAYADFQKRAASVQAVAAGRAYQSEVEGFYATNQAWPDDLADLGYDTETRPDASGQYSVGVYEGGVIGVELPEADEEGEARYLVLSPTAGEDGIQWTCSGQNVPDKWLPQDCR